MPPLPSDIAVRVATRFLIAKGYLEPGTIVLYGKYKNHRGKILGFSTDKWGNPTILVEPIPKGRKQTKEFGLYKVWRADVKENVLKQQAEEAAKAEAAALAGGDAKLASDEEWDDHDFDE